MANKILKGKYTIICFQEGKWQQWPFVPRTYPEQTLKNQKHCSSRMHGDADAYSCEKALRIIRQDSQRNGSFTIKCPPGISFFYLYILF